MNYGTAYCKTCGKKFPVTRAKQFYCSPQCKRSWINHLRRRLYWLDFEEMNCLLECTIEKLAVYVKEFERVNNKIKDFEFFKSEYERLQNENIALATEKNELLQINKKLEWQLEKCDKPTPKTTELKSDSRQNTETKNSGLLNNYNPRVKSAAEKAKPSKNMESAIFKRKCHDCGKPTNNYRCGECQTKWKQKNGISGGAAFSDDYDW